MGVCWKIDQRLTVLQHIHILNNIMLPSLRQVHGNGFIFQNDNSPIHIAEWFEINNLKVLPCPANSPDFNPMENIWVLIAKKVYENNFIARNKNDMSLAKTKFWEDLVEDDAASLIFSIGNRLQTVIPINGSLTKY